MTVADLIKLLAKLPADLEVRFAYDYGDHAHRTCAGEVDAVTIARVRHSDYTGTDVVVDENSGEEPEESDRQVVLLG